MSDILRSIAVSLDSYGDILDKDFGVSNNFRSDLSGILDQNQIAVDDTAGNKEAFAVI